MSSNLLSGDRIDAAAHAWGAALRCIADAEPRMRQEVAENGTYMVVTGSPADSVNGVFSSALRPDAGQIERLAARTAATADSFPGPVSWCVQVRSDPDDRVREVARRHGLTKRAREPFMLRDLKSVPPVPRDTGGMAVRVVTGAEHDLYARALADGFGAPKEVFAPLFTPAVLDAAPDITAYVGEVRGQVVSTALTVLMDGHVGIFNISTGPDHRESGHGRRITEEVVARGRDAGAETAYLRSSDMALPLYLSLGFSVTEHWTYFTEQ
ncbi:GNAT family N-acetyltransferase [Streptomyces sp. NPDC005195]|uniref:GNAT family N-acetyltransferase n=1 Tax=Streptomyces sp. NPDC005195 TaxID=3154561 RepID=UPI0033B0A7F4